MRAAQEGSLQHAREHDVVDEPGAAAQQIWIFEARHGRAEQGCAHFAAVAFAEMAVRPTLLRFLADRLELAP
jgi:hypothetical protein